MTQQHTPPPPRPHSPAAAFGAEWRRWRMPLICGLLGGVLPLAAYLLLAGKAAGGGLLPRLLLWGFLYGAVPGALTGLAVSQLGLRRNKKGAAAMTLIGAAIAAAFGTFVVLVDWPQVDMQMRLLAVAAFAGCGAAAALVLSRFLPKA
ncbi:hypothetical protein A7P95_02705 [Eikenella longinqua]|uniref:Uncharacterized protein n=1 Tax=Eikenella longinqua TaxID=1795827 RepID=A0A1A9RZD5_9NEIS|nr:hypothetical protein [Eikenella longinqua]OAM29954.1 hypothetical protein A7P95_02705 [Eikenella longinqua]